MVTTSSSLNAARLFSPWTLASRAYMSRPWRCFHREDAEEYDARASGTVTPGRGHSLAPRQSGETAEGGIMSGLAAVPPLSEVLRGGYDIGLIRAAIR